jgi:hypothetical protein
MDRRDALNPSVGPVGWLLSVAIRGVTSGLVTGQLWYFLDVPIIVTGESASA